jgi:hypothetical protein
VRSLVVAKRNSKCWTNTFFSCLSSLQIDYKQYLGYAYFAAPAAASTFSSVWGDNDSSKPPPSPPPPATTGTPKLDKAKSIPTVYDDLDESTVESGLTSIRLVPFREWRLVLSSQHWRLLRVQESQPFLSLEVILGATKLKARLFLVATHGFPRDLPTGGKCLFGRVNFFCFFGDNSGCCNSRASCASKCSLAWIKGIEGWRRIMDQRGVGTA